MPVERGKNAELKVFVTGATGLLGSRMLKVFPEEWQMVGACHSRPVPGLVPCELGSCHSLERALADGGYDWVVHCAAIRSPDVCERDARRAMEINAEGTRRVAEAASAVGARFAYASTDYVFSGDEPPYDETDRPDPVNVYGHAKLAGETHALSVPGGLVVRMPALYSLDLTAPSNVLTSLRDSLRAGDAVRADEECTRYYTLAEEVAAAIAYLMERGRHGVVHVSAEEPSTKRAFLQDAARALGLDADLVVPADPDASAAARPADSGLSTSLYRSLGGPPFTGCGEALPRLGAADGPR
jgi:dTDP-4-dehydrorhamnose reductase